jgi:pyruvate kinase-like protein
MNVARLNFSHGTAEEHLATVQGLRRLAAELQMLVAILQDLPGPKVRIGTFAGGRVELRAGASTRRDVLSLGTRAWWLSPRTARHWSPSTSRWRPPSIPVSSTGRWVSSSLTASGCCGTRSPSVLVSVDFRLA